MPNMKTEYDINKRFRNTFFTVIAIITIAAGLIGFFSSCKTEKWAVKKHAVIAHKYPAIPAKYCADHYDNTEYQKDSIVFIEGETVYSQDTITVNCDSVFKHVNFDMFGESPKKHVVRVPCPPCPNRVDTIYRSREEIKQNAARVEELTLKIAAKDAVIIEKDKEIKDTKDTSQFRLWWAIIATAVIALYLIIKLFGKYLSAQLTGRF